MRTAAALALAACLGACVAAPARADSGYLDVIVRARTTTAPPLVFPVGRQARAGAIEEALRYRLASRSALISALRAAREAGTVRDLRRLWIIGGFALRATPAEVDRLRRRPDVLSVAPDVSTARPATAAPELALLGIPDVWAHAGTGTLAGTTGTGVTVAVLDTGVSPFYQLGASWRGGAHDWFDPYGDFATPIDYAGSPGLHCTGHGSQVASIIVGGDDGTGLEVGGAPGARWIAARIFDNQCHSPASAIHAAFQWTLDPDGDPATPDGADIVNNSWDNPGITCDPTYEPDLIALRAAGIVPVFAAGNSTVAPSPANLPEALAVGALAADGVTARSDSAAGPSACSARTRFPDLAASGTGVPTIDNNGVSGTAAGTSVAAPQVTAILALLLSRHPGMTADEQVAALVGTATDLGSPGTTGAGRPNALAAFESALPAPRDLTAPRVVAGGASPNPAAGGDVVVTGHASDTAPGARLTGIVASVSIALDGGPPGPAQPVDGAFDGPEEDVTATVPVAGLTEGTHTAVLAAVDDAANAGPGTSVSFVVDRTPPTAGSVVVSAGDGVFSFRSDATDSLSGVAGGEWFVDADPGVGNGVPLVFATGAPGDASVTLGGALETADLAPGTHTVSVRARDAAGTWSAPAAASFRVARFILKDGFEQGLGRWSTVHGLVSTSRRAAIAGRAGLLVSLSGRRAAYVASTAPGNVRSLTAGLAIDVRRAVLPGPTRVFEGLARNGRRTLSIDVRHPLGYRAAIRLCAATCSAWHPLGSATHALRLDYAPAGATLTLDGAPVATLAGPLTGQVDTFRLGAVGAAAGSRGTLHLDAFTASRAG